MVILALWENLNFRFHSQFPLNLTYIITKVGNMLKVNDIWEKNQEKLVIQV